MLRSPRLVLRPMVRFALGPGLRRWIAIAAAPVLFGLAGCSSSSSAAPATDVAGSSECTAYCNKATSLMCPGTTTCNEAETCAIKDDSCADAARARLNCIVNTGRWECATTGYSIEFSCSDFNELCTGGAPDTGITDSGRGDVPSF